MSAFPQTHAFGAATVILPVVNETYSLAETVESILKTSKADVRELLIVICDKTTPESRATIDGLSARLGDLVVVHRQKLKFLGGAMREAFDLARGTHTIMMASDLETDPALVPRLIAEARKNPSGIVTVTRWRDEGNFENYDELKLLANWIFQKLFSALYWTNLTDMTYAYRIFPTKLLQAIEWEELRHPFLFETMVKPLRLGVKVTEIPGIWRARTEGESQNTFFRNFEYFRIGLRVRFASAQSLLRNEAIKYPGVNRPSEHRI
jgi:glycosyltransferase involved in cell wall biosynthesis